jgi:hypothetical protein
MKKPYRSSSPTVPTLVSSSRLPRSADRFETAAAGFPDGRYGSGSRAVGVTGRWVVAASRIASMVVLAALAAAPAPALAEGSDPPLAAGGLLVGPNAGLTVAAQDLRVSEKAIEATWDFVNASDRDLTTLVAFPLPTLTPIDADLFEGRGGDPVDFLASTIEVDGKKITPTVEQHASVLGLDVTARLAADGVALNPYTGPKAREALAALAPDKRGFYADRGMAVWLEGAPTGLAWTVSTTFHWMQSFPKGKTVRIVHRYRPMVGRELVTEATLDRWATPGAGRDAPCLDKAGGEALRKALAAAKRPDGSTALMQRRIAYRLAPPDGPAGPIGHFRVTVEKPKPTTLAAVCLDGATAKAGPTGLVFEATNFVPKSDLSVMLVELGGK